MREPLTKRSGPQSCESCGREFAPVPGYWICPSCGYDNKVGTERGKWFQRLCTKRSVERAKRRRAEEPTE